MVTTGNDVLQPTSPQISSIRQRLFSLTHLLFVLIDLVVLNLFVEYSDYVVIELLIRTPRPVPFRCAMRAVSTCSPSRTKDITPCSRRWARRLTARRLPSSAYRPWLELEAEGLIGLGANRRGFSFHFTAAGVHSVRGR